MRSKKIFTKLIASILVVIFFALVPTTAFGDNEDVQTFIAYTTAIMTPANDSAQQIIMESYLANTDDTTKDIKPCDFVFIMDQSKWMNTEDDKGAQRAAIISELKKLIGALATPSEGEHRIAIAGYGRLNLNAVDPYDKDIYPGAKVTSTGISFNTGYYTTNGFVSKNGWSDLSTNQMSSSGLPKMSDNYKSSMTYDNAFMSLDEADSVLNADTMNAWYSGASRMDAGLTIAEQLAIVANENDTNDERDLIVCILASSLPIQNTFSSNTSVIRKDAVLAASDVLKDEGATIFAFGDYHASGKKISGDVQDTEETFNTVMQQVCTKPEYFYSFSSFTSVTDALNEMITQITITAAGEVEQSYTVKANEFYVTPSDEEKTITWQSVLDYYGDNATNIINKTKAKIEFYTFTDYDDDGNPQFESEPYSTFEVPLKNIAKNDTLAYDTELIPIPSVEEESHDEVEHTHYGNKVKIIISAPVSVTYQWASDEEGYAPSNAILPDTETVVLGTTHKAASVKYSSSATDEHYIFDGWYTDAECKTKYTGTTAVDSDITLYGKWEKYLLVEYYWNIWETNYEYSDDNDRLDYNEIPVTFTPDGISGYNFEGWYLDKDFTTKYEPEPLTQDLKLYAKWTTIIDDSKYVLPETGGVGTTIFIIVGLILILGSSGAILIIYYRKKT